MMRDQAYIFKFEVTYMCDCNVCHFPTNTMDCLLVVVESHEQPGLNALSILSDS